MTKIISLRGPSPLLCIENMKQSTDNKTKTLLTGVLLGLAAGTLLGLAFAAAKGSDPGHKLCDLSDESGDEICKNKSTTDQADAFDPEADRPV